MLYVFLVDTGTMLTLDMNLAMDSVASLQSELARIYRIPEDKQVLLISGGENLSPTMRVCSYSAGTDTNPIFLFSKMTIEAATPPSASVSYGSDTDLRDQVEGSQLMPATYETVVSRVQLALQFHDVAKEEMHVCERLVHDQHLQHQGWAAVVANLEDISSAFKNRSEIFKQNFEEYLQRRSHYVNILTSFSEVVSLLSRIPLLPSLQGELAVAASPTATETTESDAVAKETVAKEMEDAQTDKESQSLLDWISAQDHRSSVEQMAEQCSKGLEQFDESVLENLVSEFKGIVEAVDNPSMKEVKGLEDRLYGLEQLMYGARRLVQEQGEMAQGFVQNQNRASNLRDNSVLPDLCASHKRQLQVMLKNHQHLRDIRRRCTLAKEELSVNLHTRLRWVMYVEKTVCDVDGKLVIYHENLKKLKRKLEIIQQMCDAPRVYVSAVVEVVRRRHFSQHFLRWANKLSEDSGQVHTEEFNRRQEFSTFLKRHFLQTLFPGFDDMPPPFATESPNPFDVNLPQIESGEIEMLRETLPELQTLLREPEVQDLEEKLSSLTLHEATSAGTVISAPGNLDATDLNTSDIVILNQGEISPPGGITTSEIKTVITEPEDKSGDTLTFKDSTNTELMETVQPLKLEESSSSKSVEVLEIGESIEVKSSTSSGHANVSSQEEGAVVTLSCHTKGGIKKGKSGGSASKLASDSSPDLEEVSEGFTTADFYIDESMPSSMTDSPPNKVSKDTIMELQRHLHEKATVIETTQKELQQCQKKLNTAQDNFRLLHDLTEKGSLKLKCEVLSIEKQLQKDRDEFQDYMELVTKQVVNVITKLEAEEVQIRRSQLEKLEAEHSQLIGKHEEKMELANGKLEDAQREVEMYQQQVRSLQEKYDSTQQDYEARLTDLVQNQKVELEELSKKALLEHEIEMDKLRSDLLLETVQKEQELQESKEEIAREKTKLEKLVEEKEKEIESIREQYAKEMQDVVQKNMQESEEKRQAALQELEKELEKAHNKKVEILTQESHDTHTTALQHLTEKLHLEKDNAVGLVRTELEKQHESTVNELTVKFHSEREQCLCELRESLQRAHSEQVAGLETELAAARVPPPPPTETHRDSITNEAQTDFVEILTSSRHEEIVGQLKESFEEEKAKAVAEALEEKERAFQAEKETILLNLEKDKEDSLNSMKTSLVAEKQVAFNEAVNRVSAEKDRVIEELKGQRSKLEAELEAQKEVLEKLQSDQQSPGGAIASESGTYVRGADSRESQPSLEMELAETKQQLVKLQSSMMASGMMASVMPLSECASSNPEERIEELEMMLKTREQEITSMRQKVMELSMSQSSRSLIQDKVSITTCNVGDIVLLCLDERHDHYVVFTVGTTLHFLHSDCLAPLNLKAAPGESRKSWVLAEIMDKEYCQAKKPNNRFKVPVNTKFYRVKAKPWDREAALRKDSPTHTGSPRK